MSEEVAMAVADLAHTRRLQRQLAAHRALAERLDVFAATVFPGELSPMQRMLWSEVRAALAAADASVGRAGGGGAE